MGAIFLGLTLLGCGDTSREKEAVGTWISPNPNRKNLMIKIKEDRTWSTKLPMPQGEVPCEGSWTINGDVIVFATTKLSETPIEEIRKGLEKLPEDARDQIEGFLKDETFKLTPDGKNLVMADLEPGQAPRVFERRE